MARWNDRLGEATIASYEADQRHRQEVLRKLDQIDRIRLSAADQLNYDLFRKDLAFDVERHQFRPFVMPIHQRGGVQTSAQLAELLRFETAKDYSDWIARLRAFPKLIDENIALMREGITTRRIWPKVVLQRVPAQIEKLLVKNPEESAYYAPFKNMPASVPDAEQRRLRDEASRVISEAVVPGFRRFHDFFVNQYLPAAPDKVGLANLPGGAAQYALEARRYTTTNLTPQQIHDLGLREVARIRGEMQRVMTRVGFTGTHKEFFAKLRTSPEFYYKTSDELFIAYQAASKRIDPNLVKVFRTMPRMPYGVVKIPDEIAPDTTTAYYRSPAADGSRPGLYFVNLYKPETRPKYEIMALSLHEAVPGHHFQIALAQELGEIPNFRRYGGYTAFIEGWGLYAESLGDDMGLYDDPYSKFGQLTYEMWRAVRLVVDTGMHALGWSRQQAIDYFMDNAAKSELDIVNEIDRYITNAGQALAYKIGELKFKELRARTKEKLGARFDVRIFHDAVLASGAIPLDVLERNIDSWIATELARPVKQSP